MLPDGPLRPSDIVLDAMFLDRHRLRIDHRIRRSRIAIAGLSNTPWIDDQSLVEASVELDVGMTEDEDGLVVEDLRGDLLWIRVSVGVSGVSVDDADQTVELDAVVGK